MISWPTFWFFLFCFCFCCFSFFLSFFFPLSFSFLFFLFFSFFLFFFSFFIRIFGWPVLPLPPRLLRPWFNSLNIPLPRIIREGCTPNQNWACFVHYLEKYLKEIIYVSRSKLSQKLKNCMHILVQSSCFKL